ncbi:MAG: hypothetical protein C0473_02080 [Cyanobacteria bacterium DS3.002]|nr:hypothetical protein [Cyanobacteria bacterium DS3.002]MBA4050083.1 hypothetical protein [Cyanobacteria bacterium DS2.008]
MFDPYNKQMLLRKLPGLSAMARVVFASSCASRLIPTYELIHEKDGSGEPVKLKTALDYCWESVLAGVKNEAECKLQLQVVEDLVDAAYSSTSAFPHYSHDATSIVYYSLHALLSGEIEDPIWAVQCIYESVCRYIVTKEELVIKGKQGLKGQKLISRINYSPLMQQEFSRELRDIEELSCGYSPEKAQLAKRRAEAEPAFPAELPDTSNLPSVALIQAMMLRDSEFCL